MLFHCSRVQAEFPGEKLALVNRDHANLLWDEHGGIFVMRVDGMETMEYIGSEAETIIRLEVDLPEPPSLAHRIESFASRHSLDLTQQTASAEMSETPILAACHVPARTLFIFCENPRLTVHLKDRQSLELQMDGVFQARRVPSHGTDLVIHLEMAAMSRLLAWLLAWAKQGNDI